MMHHAEELRLTAGLDNLRFVVSDYEEMPFTREFDAVVFHDALHHAVDEELAVRRAFQALRPGGRCITVEPGDGPHNSEHALEAVPPLGVTEEDMPPAEIIDLGRRAGFRSFLGHPRIP